MLELFLNKFFIDFFNINWIIWFIIVLFVYGVWNLYEDSEWTVKILHRNLPTLLTSLGVLGTFLGVYQALQSFRIDNIDQSIGDMIVAMKDAFLTSVMGLFWAIIYKGVDAYKNRNEKISNSLSDSIKEAIKEVTELFNEGLMDRMGEAFKELNESIKDLNKWVADHREQINENQEMLKQTSSNYQEILDKTDGVFDKIDNSVSSISKNIEDINQYSENITKLSTSLDESLDNIDSHLKKLSGLDVSSINKNIESLSDNISKTSEQVEKQTKNTDEITRGIEYLSKQLTTTMDNLGKNIEDIKGATSDLKNSMQWAKGFDNINIVDQLDSVLNRVDSASQELKEFPSRLEIVTTKAIEDIGKTSDNNLEEFSRKLASISEKFAYDYEPITNHLRDVINIANSKDKK